MLLLLSYNSLENLKILPQNIFQGTRLVAIIYYWILMFVSTPWSPLAAVYYANAWRCVICGACVKIDSNAIYHVAHSPQPRVATIRGTVFFFFLGNNDASPIWLLLWIRGHHVRALCKNYQFPITSIIQNIILYCYIVIITMHISIGNVVYTI